MLELFLSWGPWGLFVAAMLAGSVFPVPSEAVLGALVALGKDPWPLVVLAAGANTIGAASLVLIGRKGRPFAAQRLGEARLARFEGVFRRFGAPLLLLGFIPAAGDVFIVMAGVLRIPWLVVLPLVCLGKATRYVAVALGARALAGM